MDCAVKRERLPGRHAQLLQHQVGAGHHLGHRVLDLNAGVHLDEVTAFAGGVVDELDGARVLVGDAAREADRSLADLLAQRGRKHRGR